jgi:hypothetical protein
LCPLQRSDVETPASAVGVESQAFLDEVERHAATAMATRPITLEFLLNSFKSGSMATTRDELFRQGCLHLCTEINEYRSEASPRARAPACGQDSGEIFPPHCKIPRQDSSTSFGMTRFLDFPYTL